ncbi:hypothetical protein GWI34_25240 [Actinomadura sp. DSM 109109]|nr:hypothetical protein [Actinomadura lepetitiana]
MSHIMKYRRAVLLLCLLAGAGVGFLVLLGGLSARHAESHVKDWGTCPDGREIYSLAKGFSTPTNARITGHRVQPGCAVAVKDPTGTVLYTEVIRSHRYVMVTGHERTVTRLVDGRDPEKCELGDPYDGCFLSTLPSTGKSHG